MNICIINGFIVNNDNIKKKEYDEGLYQYLKILLKSIKSEYDVIFIVNDSLPVEENLVNISSNTRDTNYLSKSNLFKGEIIKSKHPEENYINIKIKGTRNINTYEFEKILVVASLLPPSVAARENI